MNLKRHCQAVVFISLVSSLAPAGLFAAPQLNEPGALWTDDRGWPINAHGGGLYERNGTYWWYGEHKIYGKAGKRAHAGVHCYSSKNLKDWKDEGIAFAVDPDGNIPVEDGCILERPKVVYCPNTGLTLMFFHFESKSDRATYSGGMVGIAQSVKPEGPFRFLYATRPCGTIVRDQTVFVDDDGKAYFVAASGPKNCKLAVFPLNSDYIDFTGEKFVIDVSLRDEAPAVFKHDGWYYILASDCTGWRPNAARYFRSRAMTGPWERMPNPCVGVDPATGLGPDLTWGGQSTYVLKLPDNTFIAMFDRWNESGGIHDSRYVWLPFTVKPDHTFEIVWPGK